MFHSKSKVYFSFLFVGIITCLLFVFILGIRANDDEQATLVVVMPAQLRSDTISNHLQVELPDSARVGDVVTGRLLVKEAVNLDGFQVTLRFDPAVLRLTAIGPAKDLTNSGRDVLELGPVRFEDSLTFGAALCPVADCTTTRYQEALSQAGQFGSLSGDVELATFSLQVNKAGLHEIRLDEVLLVDAAGKATLTSNMAEPLAIEATTLEQLDITNNNVINDADAWRVIAVWAGLQEEGVCYHEDVAYFDVNNSGCIDATDVQLILSQWGMQVSSGAPVPEAALSTPIDLIVNSAGDEPDTNPGDGVCLTAKGECTLRAAIQEANQRPGRETIRFDIRPNGPSTCPSLVTIKPSTSSSNLLEIDDPFDDGVVIDGYTQCGAAPNTGPIGGNAQIKIEIQGVIKSGVHGLVLTSGNNIVRGLAIYHWHHQIYMPGGRSHHNTIEGNFVGTNATNTQETNLSGLPSTGVQIEWGAYNNVVGGTTPAARNIIAGNRSDGIELNGTTRDNRVIGNYIGLKQDGRTSLGNKDGVDVNKGARSNYVGGLNPGERNVISGNRGDGVEISHNDNSIEQYNHIVGNYIGLNAYGEATAESLNLHRGVTFEDLVRANEVYRNVIVNNGYHGVRFDTSFHNKLYDNFIGVAPAGLGPGGVIPRPIDVPESSLVIMPNSQSGVFMHGGSQHNKITTNTIAHNTEYGIFLTRNPGWPEYSTCEVYFNTFSRNSIFNNNLQGIRLNSGTCPLNGQTYYPNQGIVEPNLQETTTLQVRGIACANCLVEIFIADKTEVNSPGDNSGEGKIFIASGTADGSGSFTVPINVATGAIITATATDSNGNTSQFARNREAVQAEGTPGPGTADVQIYLPYVANQQ